MENETKKCNLSPAVSILIAGVIVAGAVILSSRVGGGAVAAQPTQQPAAAPIAADVRKVNTAGEPFIGNVNTPVTMAYWYDYQCPFCQRNEENAMPQLLKEYVDTGKVKIVFKDYEFLGPDSQTLGQYSRAVWEAVPGKFYQWHKAIFDNQGTENTGWASKDKILSITTTVLGAGDSAKVTQLVATKSAEYQKQMDADKTEGTAMGINGTPGAIIGKQLVSGAVPYAQYQTAIEAALNR